MWVGVEWELQASPAADQTQLDALGSSVGMMQRSSAPHPLPNPLCAACWAPVETLVAVDIIVNCSMAIYLRSTLPRSGQGTKADAHRVSGQHLLPTSAPGGGGGPAGCTDNKKTSTTASSGTTA